MTWPTDSDSKLAGVNSGEAGLTARTIPRPSTMAVTGSGSIKRNTRFTLTE